MLLGEETSGNHQAYRRGHPDITMLNEIRAAKECGHGSHTPNANMADRLVGAQDELHESEASKASVFCFDNASPEKSCFVDNLVCFISICLLVFVFLNATRRDRNCPTFASKGK